MAWDSRVTFEACVNVLSAVSHVDSLNSRRSSSVCAPSCFLRGACSLGEGVRQVSVSPA